MIIMEIARERDRQIKAEGFTLEHDDRYRHQELPLAATAFVAHSMSRLAVVESTWPWAPRWWKPKTERDSLVKAAALIVAEIERRDRRAERKSEKSHTD